MPGPAMTDAPDLYATLGVGRSATDIEVKRGVSSGAQRQQGPGRSTARLPPSAFCRRCPSSSLGPHGASLESCCG